MYLLKKKCSKIKATIIIDLKTLRLIDIYLSQAKKKKTETNMKSWNSLDALEVEREIQWNQIDRRCMGLPRKTLPGEKKKKKKKTKKK